MPETAAAASRRYPVRPVLGVSAVLFRGDRVLMVERGGVPLQGQWSLPGGGVETGETLDAAVRREVLEETGLTLLDVNFFEIFERIMRDAEDRIEYHYVLITSLCRAAGEAHAGDDVSRTAWVRRDELSNYVITEGTAAIIERAFDRR